jgi:hypothetical protein
MNTNEIIDHYYATENAHSGELILLAVAILVIIAAIVFFKLYKSKNSN